MVENKADKIERIEKLKKHYKKEMRSYLIFPITQFVMVLICIVIILFTGKPTLCKENIDVIIIYCIALILLFIGHLYTYKYNKTEVRKRINDEIFNIIYWEDTMKELNCVENEILNENESHIIYEPSVTIEIPEKYICMIGYEYYWLDLDRKKVRKVEVVNIRVGYDIHFKKPDIQIVVMYKGILRYKTKNLSEIDCELKLFSCEDMAKEKLKYFV